ncbi:MAG: carboxylesterase family protein [Terriglobales bacterium]
MSLSRRCLPIVLPRHRGGAPGASRRPLAAIPPEHSVLHAGDQVRAQPQPPRSPHSAAPGSPARNGARWGGAVRLGVGPAGASRIGRLSRPALAVAAALALLGAARPPRAPRVRTASGMVAGRRLPGGVRLFAGIPFAARPVGPGRWRPPGPAPAWSGVRPARRFAPPCMQPPAPGRMGPWTRVFLSQRPPSENCLGLNVWAPPSRRRLRAVMVWIYGGGFVEGAGSVPIYNGAALARRGVVVVNFNYRLGALGFLALPALARESPHHSAGNYALLDQIAALRWVRRNIAAFGGDPRRVTIFGQSAGAVSVGLLLRSPLAQGLFQRAIIMSGQAALPVPGLMGGTPLAAAERRGQTWAAQFGLSGRGPRLLAQLRALPAMRIVAARASPQGPIMDGWVVPSGPGPRRQAEVMIGMVADDIGIGYYGTGPRPRPTWAAYHAGLRQLCGADAAHCAQLYPAANAAAGRAALTAARQDRARVSIAEWAARQMRYSPRVYTYYFNHAIPWPQHPQYGVFHSSGLPYVFSNLWMMARPWQPTDYRLARRMSSYWVNFAKHGNPNGSGLPRWPAFQPGHPQTMQLGAPMAPMPLAPPARRRFWRRHLRHPLGS